MDVSPKFPDRLLMARRRANLEQEELARRAGMTRYLVGRLERGQATQISIEALRRLARALGVTTDWLLAMDVTDEESTHAEQVEEDLIATPHA